jgi:hypothetical protein
MNNLEIAGSCGEVIIDETGAIISRTGYEDIASFNMKSMHPKMLADLMESRVTDILYIGYWENDGRYEAPIDVTQWGGMTEANYLAERN